MLMPVPVAIVDALNSLLEAEQGSVIRFMGEGSPYLGRADADVRRPLQLMVETNRRHVGELWRLIDDLGAEPRPGRPQPAEQYLAFLSLKFLMPKLIEAKELLIRRYESALKAVGKGQEHVAEVLQRHVGEHRSELAMLQRATEQVMAGK